jgi:aldehyde:ferredoxin oxidoreductase
MLDTLELCQFVWGPAWTLYGPAELIEFIKAVTGWDVSIFELMKVGERRINMMRVFNAREGFDRKDDALPRKFYKPLGGSGPTAGVAIKPQEFEEALDLYYKLMKWTPDGIPTRENMIDLGIEWLANELPAYQNRGDQNE